MAKYYSEHKNFRTKPLYIFLFCLIAIIIPGLCLWLFYGYINFSGAYLVFPTGGIIAQGTANQLVAKLAYINAHSNINEQIRINANAAIDVALKANQNSHKSLIVYLAKLNHSYYSPLIAAIIVPLLLWSIGSPFILKPAKIINYDTISFSFACAGLFSMLLITAGIPVGTLSNSNSFNYIGPWIILVRIIIVAISLPVFFFVSDRIVLLFLKTSKNPGQYYVELSQETVEIQQKEKQLKTQMAKRKLARKEKEFIEINANRISYRKTKKGDVK